MSSPLTPVIIFVAEGKLYNLFPTDLHGLIGSDYYLISLRHAGKACQQVKQVKRIVLSDISTSSYKKVYSLGKNHMQPLKDGSNFNWSPFTTKNWRLLLPEGVISYQELE